MNAKSFLVNGPFLGLGLWLLGFALGMMLFPFVEPRYIGIPILAVMLPTTLVVLYWRFREGAVEVATAWLVGATWLLVAVVFDYVFLVAAFNVEAYYDPDIFVYYGLTLLSPPVVAWHVRRRLATKASRPT